MWIKSSYTVTFEFPAQLIRQSERKFSRHPEWAALQEQE